MNSNKPESEPIRQEESAKLPPGDSSGKPPPKSGPGSKPSPESLQEFSRGAMADMLKNLRENTKDKG